MFDGTRTSLVLVLTLAASLSVSRSEEIGVVEEIVQQTHAIDPGASIDIRNVDGSIRIYGADTRELRIQAIKKAYSAERLSKIAVNVSVQPGAASIETVFPPRPKWGFSDRSGTVDYILVVPQFCSLSRLELVTGEVLIDGMRGENLHANLVNGRLVSHNCFGDVRLAVTNGGLDVGYHWWERRRFSVNAEIENGNVHAFIPGEASFHVIAASVNGQVASDFTAKQDRQGNGVAKIDMLVGGASEAEVNLHATNGNIRIAEANP
jgi:putative adhesin